MCSYATAKRRTKKETTIRYYELEPIANALEHTRHSFYSLSAQQAQTRQKCMSVHVVCRQSSQPPRVNVKKRDQKLGSHPGRKTKTKKGDKEEGGPLGTDKRINASSQD